MKTVQRIILTHSSWLMLSFLCLSGWQSKGRKDRCQQFHSQPEEFWAVVLLLLIVGQSRSIQRHRDRECWVRQQEEAQISWPPDGSKVTIPGNSPTLNQCQQSESSGQWGTCPQYEGEVWTSTRCQSLCGHHRLHSRCLVHYRSSKSAAPTAGRRQGQGHRWDLLNWYLLTCQHMSIGLFSWKTFCYLISWFQDGRNSVNLNIYNKPAQHCEYIEAMSLCKMTWHWN